MILLDKTTWEIKKTKKKGRGIFAKKDIPAGTVVGDYLGKIIAIASETAYEEDYGLYLMYYNERATIFPHDINAPGIHLINHSCAPNNWMYTYKGHTLFFALRHIFAGEELTVSYLLGPDETCDPCPHICICSSKICIGTMHAEQAFYDAWDAFNTKITKETQREPVTIGKDLPKLKDYPETISDAAIYPLFGSVTETPFILEHTTLPSVPELRKKIRESGRVLYFPSLKTRIQGVKNNEVVLQALK